MSAELRSSVILTRDAAKILGMSMSRVRKLAAEGTLHHVKLGSRALGFDEKEVNKLRVERVALRKAGSMRGNSPMGFSPDKRYDS